MPMNVRRLDQEPADPTALRWPILALCALAGALVSITVAAAWEAATGWLADDLSRAWR